MMTDPIKGPPAAKTPAPTRRGLGPGLRRLLLGGAFAVTFMAGGLVMSGTPAAALSMAINRAGMGSHGDMHAMMQAHVEKMLTEVGATPDQRSRINTILATSMQSIAPLHAKLADMHGDLHRLLTAPTIDRGALEQLRAAAIADLDQASKALVGGLADAASVLSPEQRAKLATLMARGHQPHM
jgi:Spy/CpxP family protein refolding chaperone